jgi:poly(U)-specific endoribonuclease
LSVDEKLWSVSTVEKMRAFYNNYEQDTAINEYVSPIERKEEDDFIDAVLATPVMR